MVEADRAYNHLDPVGDTTGDRIFDLAFIRAFRGFREAEQRPQNDRCGKDNGACAAQEYPGALPQADRNIAQPRHLVTRHFDQETALAAVGHEALDDRGDQHCANNARHIQPKQYQPLQPDARADAGCRNEGANDQGINRQSRRAGHQRCDQDRRQPFLLIHDRARRHDAGNGAGE